MTQKTLQPRRPRASWLLCAGATLLAPPIAMAEDAPSADPPAGTLKEVIVTAQKRSEPLQRVPISIAAVTSQEIEQRSMTDLQQVAQATPNVSFYYQPQVGTTAGLIYIRGIGQNDTITTDDPGVGVYVDGVYYGRMQGVNIDSLDVARIEILRGPQGTLYGKNTIGGAVNIVTNEPSLESYAGDARLTGGSYNRADATAWVSLPVVQDKLAVSLAAGSRNQSGYGTRLSDGQGMGNVKELDGRIDVRYKASDTLELRLAADGTRINEDQADQKLLAVNPASPLVGLLNLISNPPYDSRWLTNSDFTSYATGSNFNRADIWGSSLTATWDAGPVTVKSITAYRRNKTDAGTDPDGSPLTLIDQITPLDQSQFSEELQFSGLSLGQRLNWVGGLYYFHELATQDVRDAVFTALLAPPIGLDASFNTNVGARNWSYAAYGQGTYALTDKLHFTFGLRETYEEKAGSVFRYAPFSGDATIIPFTQHSRTWSSLTPKAALDYQFTPTVMGYVSFATGFKSGGFNGEANNAAGLVPYGPEKAYTYETGLRSEWLGRRLLANATAYYTDYKGIQYTIGMASPNGQPNIVVGNAASARIDGGELELALVPIENLTLSASGGLTDAKYTSVATGAQVTTSSPFLDTPKWTGRFSAQYAFDLTQNLQLMAHTDWVYRSLVYFALPITPYVIQGGYSTLDARLTLRSIQNDWSIAAFGTNLTDKRYVTTSTDYTAVLGFATAFFAPPREWGVTLEYRF
jgi:iron complex outermembrane recepter protein